MKMKNKEKIEELIKKYPVNPYELLYKDICRNQIEVKNVECYKTLEQLEKLLLPTKLLSDKIIYKYLFLPFEDEGKSLKFIPLSLIRFYNSEEYAIAFPLGFNMRVRKGEDSISRDVFNLINLLYSFAELRLKDPIPISESDISKKFIRGRVKLKYVEKPVITKKEAKAILEKYRENRKRKLSSDSISLREYLKVVGLVYDALGFLEISKASIEEIIEKRRRYGDFRDCNLLDLPLDDVNAFEKWRKENVCGSHPFEIVAGYLYGGIYLFPPSHGRFMIYTSFPNEEIYKIICRLIKEKIPFTTNLKEILEVLSGEVFVNVNEPTPFPPRFIFYEDVKRKDKIVWDEFKEVRYKGKSV